MTLLGISLDQLVVLPIALLAFVTLLSVIVFFHEYGHFSVARLLGVRVDVFSLGFGKAIAQWTDRHGTEWRISWLPLGGYVKFFGDAGPASNASQEVTQERGGYATTQFPKPGDEAQAGQGMTPEEKAVCFHFKPLWRRAAIVAAGPMANFILAIAIFAGLLMLLGEGYYPSKIREVAPDSAAADAGFQAGDEITAINGRPIGRFDEIRNAVILNAGEEMSFRINRAGQELTINTAPRRQESQDAFGNVVMVGVLGVRPDPAEFAFARYGLFKALNAASQRVWNILGSTVKFIGRLFQGKEDPAQLGGPLKIAQFAGQSALSGFDESNYQSSLSIWTKLKVSLANFVNLAAVLSVSIGFLNLLPIPVLDGGHLMYYAYEGVAGRPLGQKAQAFGFKVGFVMLASLMLFVTWNDINALIQKF